MRKRRKGRKLSMKMGPRKQLLKSLANSFFLHGKITTTEARAKELRPIVEKIITRAKDNSVASRRALSQKLIPSAIKKVIDEIAPKYKARPGGYTRVIKLGPRNSDGANIVVMELV